MPGDFKKGKKYFSLSNTGAQCVAFAQQWLKDCIATKKPCTEIGNLADSALMAQMQKDAAATSVESLKQNGLKQQGQEIVLNDVNWADAFQMILKLGSDAKLYVSIKYIASNGALAKHVFACLVKKGLLVYHLEPEIGLFMIAVKDYLETTGEWYTGHSGNSVCKEFKIYLLQG